jgi:hypothetical protein
MLPDNLLAIATDAARVEPLLCIPKTIMPVYVQKPENRARNELPVGKVEHTSCRVKRNLICIIFPIG